MHVHLCIKGDDEILTFAVTENVDQVVRKTVSLPTGVWRQIEDFQFDNRIKRETEAIRRLIELGLKAATSRETVE